MNYIQITIPSTQEALNEILIAELASIGFDGFEESENTIQAFIEEVNFREVELETLLQSKNLSFQKTLIPKQNWNELWESNFDTVVVDDFVGVRADFHEPIANVTHEILITPKMSFGTGHHATTFMMMQLMRHLDFIGKTVFDFGTGTGILAILAEKLGSTKVMAIDNDEWCIENSAENIAKNNCSKIEILLAEKPDAKAQFDIIIANINKHIILENISFINEVIKVDGDILLSGLLIDDDKDIYASISSFKWKHIQTLHKGDWIAIQFKKV
jgi:ribosomal protein L11 methyltransferase